ncbi:hypothetical protein [Ruminococcus sp.]|uniref:hypothetical protein n=1 Tax=Ruminococcus sp. TaxID=41978 RepID=UPI0025ED19FB|nr:hypothetical protein [Ruminococcus sp.]
MMFLFENAVMCTEALVTAVEILNDFGQYELTVLGIDQGGCYTNKGTVTIDEDELEAILSEKALPFPKGILGQRVRIISDKEMQKKQEQTEFFQKIAEDGEELIIDMEEEWSE